jgi:hypothetical protein
MCLAVAVLPIWNQGSLRHGKETQSKEKVDEEESQEKDTQARKEEIGPR